MVSLTWPMAFNFIVTSFILYRAYLGLIRIHFIHHQNPLNVRVIFKWSDRMGQAPLGTDVYSKTQGTP